MPIDKDKININEILSLLPHRYPFMLVDSILEYEKEVSLLGLKNVTYNEPYFQGHFPESPVMPGVMIIEALAQAAGLLIYCTTGKSSEIFYLAGLDNVRFRQIVRPGDQLLLHVNIERRRKDIWKFTSKATVKDDVVCAANLVIAK